MHINLQQIVDQTDEMIHLAEDGDWEKLSEVDQSRNRTIKAYFAADLLNAEPDVASIIQDIQAKDKNILRMVLSAKDGVRLEMAQAGNNQRAVKAYFED